MKRTSSKSAVFQFLYRCALRARFLLGKQTCRAFGQVNNKGAIHSIDRVYIINLDRQPSRLKQVWQELSNVIDASGFPLTDRVVRIRAVDAQQFGNIVYSDAVEWSYTLGDQLFVDPRRVLPAKLNIDEKIEMSRQEVAVALSHIHAWKQVAAGNDEYALILEDDVYFRHSFGRYVERIWQELSENCKEEMMFDMLYLSFEEVKNGAEKIRISENTFRLYRGLWCLSGYVLSKRGAKKLLNLLPVWGPVDLWVNHKFCELNAIVVLNSVIVQRMDEKSENMYSVLPTLTKIGVLNSEATGEFRTGALVKPVFAFGETNAGLTSLAMALSMLGYKCYSDLEKLPAVEESKLLLKDGSRVFDAYVNIGSLDMYIDKLAVLYPEAKLIFLVGSKNLDIEAITRTRAWSERALVMHSGCEVKWKLLCEFLGIAPPASPYPEISELGQRHLRIGADGDLETLANEGRWLKADKSPWIAPLKDGWNGVSCGRRPSSPLVLRNNGWIIADDFECLNVTHWDVRDDTFPGNLALFNPSNVLIINGGPANLIARREDMGVRQYSSGAITTKMEFLFGRFEVVIKPSKVTGLVTGIFLHRNSPRQEIDIEFLGKDPRRILVNVYYNPGGLGARFDYGYRGTPFVIDLGFDATRDFHTYAIEWVPDELRWFVDGHLVHSRVNWGPTPIPHLPMRFHVNLWPSRSRKLAGKLAERCLPAAAVLRSVRISENV
jgi:GR25 family glycosyltransferase involved in LPS biosynthesis